MSAFETPSVFVVGCGSIGRRHVENLRTLGVRNIAAYDPVDAQLRKTARDHQVQPCTSLEHGLGLRPKAVLVCTPPASHVAIASRAIEAGAHVFVEKPLAHSSDGTEGLLRQASEAGLVVLVGYNLRFHAGIRRLKAILDAGSIGKPLVIRAEVGQYLPDWRPDQDYRTGYIARVATGGGIILDASHELDYVSWLLGPVRSVYCAAGHLSALEIETEDIAAIVLRFASGALGEVHLDCVQRGRARSCKIIGDSGTLVWELERGIHQVAADRTRQEFPVVPDVNEMYVEEMRHFLRCVRGEETPLIDGHAALATLRIALAAKRSAETGREVAP